MLGKVLRTLTGSGKAVSPGAARRRGPTCVQCRAPVTPTTVRCGRCGARVMSPSSGEAVATQRGAERARASRPVDRLETRILVRALGAEHGRTAIQVLPSKGAAVGEIKVAGERIFGDEAVRAVARLVKYGDLASLDDGFSLTPAGRRRAQALSA